MAELSDSPSPAWEEDAGSDWEYEYHETETEVKSQLSQRSTAVDDFRRTST